MPTVYLGLGANLGKRRETIDAALAQLAAHPAIRVRTVSALLETEPVGGPPGQPHYLNGAAEIETDLAPAALLAELKRSNTTSAAAKGHAGDHARSTWTSCSTAVLYWRRRN